LADVTEKKLAMSKESSRRIRNGVVAAICIAAAIAGVAYWLMRDRSINPETVELPPGGADKQALADYFAGAGQPLLLFLAATEHLGPSSTREECADLAGRLDGLGGPPELTIAAQGVPDPGLRDAAVNHLDTVGRFLVACTNGSSMDDPARETTYSATVMRRLLDREGIR
jgi:hypothetical protein